MTLSSELPRETGIHILDMQEDKWTEKYKCKEIINTGDLTMSETWFASNLA